MLLAGIIPMFAIIVQNAGKSQVLDDHKSADNTETVKGTGHWYPLYIVSFTSTTGQVVHSSFTKDWPTQQAHGCYGH